MNVKPRPQRPLYYAAVAGDVAGTYRRWRDGMRDERQTAATYSGQFFDLCAKTSRPGAASFPSDRMQFIRDGSFVLRNRPSTRSAGGARFYFDQLIRACWLYGDILRSNASDVIVMDGVTFFFLLAPLVWSGRRVFLSIHTVLWRPGTRPKLLQRIVRSMDSWFLRTQCAGCLVASPAIGEQVIKLAGSRVKVALFYPLYDKADFARFGSPDQNSRPFRIFYAGRIEIDKGIFDLLEVLHDLIREGRNVHLDVCGDGSALEQLRADVMRCGMQSSVTTHGHLNRPEMLTLLESAQVVVVPTRSSFPEGLNQVVIEATLAHRPVVTSAVCPALDLVKPAAIEAIADNPGSYRASIERLMDEPEFFVERARAGAALRQNFFDPDKAWTAVAVRLMN
jgi:glycogen synthase